MISVKVTVDTTPLLLIRERAQKMPGLLQTVEKRRVRSLRTRMKARFRIEPGPPRYPLKWQSAKQRRFVMAKLRAQNNIPYQRTHQYSESFDVVLNSTNAGGILMVTNSSPAAPFIGGEFQQVMHMITGWERIDDVVVEFQEIYFNELREDFYTVSDPFAGVPR